MGRIIRVIKWVLALAIVIYAIPYILIGLILFAVWFDALVSAVVGWNW